MGSRAKKFVRNLRSFTKQRLYSPKKLHSVVEVEYLKKLIGRYDIDCVFDVGANTGQYASQLIRKVGYQGLIISFEPTPDLVQKLTRNADSRSNWHVEAKALGAYDGEVRLQCMESSTFNSIHAPIEENAQQYGLKNVVHQTITVPQTTLTSAFKALRSKFGFERPFLKMDTQGHDRVVFESGLEVIDQFVALQSELSFEKLYEETDSYEQLIAFYQSHGFVLSALIPNNSGHFPYLLEMDCAMINRRFVDASEG